MHPWDVSPKEAVKIQRALQERVSVQDDFGEIKIVAGVDVGFEENNTNVKPLYISPGHRVSIASAIKFVMACTTKYRLPETTRWAHRLASSV